MDIEIFQGGNFVTTLEDIPESMEGLSEYLGDFCAKEGYNIGSVESEMITETAEDLLAGDGGSLAGFELKPVEEAFMRVRTPHFPGMPKTPTSLTSWLTTHAPARQVATKELAQPALAKGLAHLACTNGLAHLFFLL